MTFIEKKLGFIEKFPWFVFSLLILISNSVIPPESYWTSVGALDTSIYLSIADAAPGLPPAGSDLVFHGAQRFLVPYVLGVVAHGIGIPVWEVFKLLVQGLFVASSFFFWKTTSKITKNQNLRIIGTALLCFHVYLFRLQITFSGFLNDAVFVFGIVLLVFGLFTIRILPILIASLLMLVSKQTFFALLIPAFAWLFTNADWQKRSLFSRIFIVVFISLISAIYVPFIAGLIATFSTPPTYSKMIGGLSQWVQNSSFSSAFVDLQFFIGRGILGLFLPSIFCFLCLKSTSKNKLARVWPIIAMIFAIIAQPVAAGPVVTGGSVQRLFSLAVPLIIIFGLTQTDGSAFPVLSKKRLWILVALLFLASFHHLFSFYGPMPEMKYLFFCIQMVVGFVFYKLCSLRNFESQSV